MKVIFHIVEKEKWQATIDNAVDILAQNPESKIKIMIMSSAAELFGSYSGQDFSGLLKNPNVSFTIGQTALDKYNLSKSLLPSGVIIEKSVVAKIAELQNKGYAYIRL
ncbi:MAG: DsrE family protein [Peptoniphilaceae bacterium]